MTTMIKLKESSGANVEVLGDDQLNQVVGGHHGGHRRRNHGHGYKNSRRNDSHNWASGYEGKGYGEYGSDSDFSSDDS